MEMKLVVIESPWAGDIERNKKYLHECIKDCLERGEAPFASHGLYTEVLDEDNPTERMLGINAGLEWGYMGDKRVVYTDLGITEGMLLGIVSAEKVDQTIEYRTIHHEE